MAWYTPAWWGCFYRFIQQMLVCWFAALAPLYCCSSNKTRDRDQQTNRQGPTNQQRPKIEKCWSAGLLPRLPCTTVVLIWQETGTKKSAMKTFAEKAKKAKKAIKAVIYMQKGQKKANIKSNNAKKAKKVAQGSQGNRPTDQHFSILGLWWSAGPCLLVCWSLSLVLLLQQ